MYHSIFCQSGYIHNETVFISLEYANELYFAITDILLPMRLNIFVDLLVIWCFLYFKKSLYKSFVLYHDVRILLFLFIEFFENFIGDSIKSLLVLLVRSTGQSYSVLTITFFLRI